MFDGFEFALWKSSKMENPFFDRLVYTQNERRKRDLKKNTRTHSIHKNTLAFNVYATNVCRVHCAYVCENECECMLYMWEQIQSHSQAVLLLALDLTIRWIYDIHWICYTITNNERTVKRAKNIAFIVVGFGWIRERFSSIYYGFM